ncbi:MAG: 30S ribosomal protein THX [Sphingobacteriales bacterium]|nr:MAG: 30S ribosomal protein THX [Sphingobacteriales bacterium]
MGKGDKRTKRGKIWRGSNGKSRPNKSNRSKSTTTTQSNEN